MMGGAVFSTDVADNGIVHEALRTQQNGERIHNATQNTCSFILMNYLFLEFFHLIFWTAVGYIE